MVYGDLKGFFTPHIRVQWNLTSYCPNHCWYCIDNSQNIKPDSEIEKVERIDELLSTIFKMSYKTFEFVLLGGEPTTCKSLNYIINSLKKEAKVKNIILVTSQVTDICFDADIDIRLTIHPSSNRIPDYKALLQKRDVEIRLMLDPKYREKTVSLYNDLRSICSSFYLKEIKQPPLYNKTWSFPELIQNEDENQPSFYGKYCLLGTTVLFIKNFIWSGPPLCTKTFFPKVVKCTRNNCGCRYNSKNIIKTDTYEEAQDLLAKFLKLGK